MKQPFFRDCIHAVAIIVWYGIIVQKKKTAAGRIFFQKRRGFWSGCKASSFLSEKRRSHLRLTSIFITKRCKRMSFTTPFGSVANATYLQVSEADSLIIGLVAYLICYFLFFRRKRLFENLCLACLFVYASLVLSHPNHSFSLGHPGVRPGDGRASAKHPMGSFRIGVVGDPLLLCPQ